MTNSGRGGYRPGAGRKPSMPSTSTSRTPAIRNDGYANALVGLMKQQDKSARTTYGQAPVLDQITLENLYMGDGLATNIIDIPNDDMTREWMHLEPENEDSEETSKNPELIESELLRLDAETIFNFAHKMADLFGGAMIIVGALDGQELDVPLNPARIRTIDYLKVVTRHDVFLDRSLWGQDPKMANFGKPSVFAVTLRSGTTYQEFMIHESRVIVIPGKPTPPGATVTRNLDDQFWGVNELNHVFESIRDLGGTYASVTNILYEFIIGKFKVANLAKMLAEGKEKELSSRMEIIAMYKSIVHVMLLGEGEEYTRDSATLAGIEGVMDRFMMRVSATSRIPVSRLFGRSAGGLNATGEGDESNYFDWIRSRQRTKLKPGLQKLINILCDWKKVKEKLKIEFYPLFQLTEKEEAEVEKIEADTKLVEANTYKTYVDMGALDAEQVYQKELADKFGPPTQPAQPPAGALTPEQQASVDKAAGKLVSPPTNDSANFQKDDDGASLNTPVTHEDYNPYHARNGRFTSAHGGHATMHVPAGSKGKGTHIAAPTSHKGSGGGHAESTSVKGHTKAPPTKEHGSHEAPKVPAGAKGKAGKAHAAKADSLHTEAHYDAYYNKHYADKMLKDYGKNPSSFEPMNSIIGGGSDYKAISSRLINGGAAKTPADKKLDKKIEGVDKFISAYGNPTHIQAYRGLSDAPAIHGAKVGDSINAKGFSAFSGKEGWAQSFMGRGSGKNPVVIKTTLPPGTAAPGINIKFGKLANGTYDKGPIQNTSEMEFIAKRGLSMKVTGIETKTAMIGGKKMTYKEVTVEVAE